ncbi:MAG: hypothetical protein AB8B59_15625 [Maribacter sp.]
MKKVVRSIAVVALMFFTVTGLANEPKLSLTPNTEKSLNFEMDLTSEKTLVSILDNDGVIIYTESVQGKDIYSKKFDLNNLPQGGYFLKVEETMKETIFSFAVVESKIVISEKTENTKPVFRKKEGRVFVNLLNLEKEEVRIKIVDSEFRIVFEEEISNEVLIEKVFNFEDAFKDSYTVIVQNANSTYYDVVNVK